MRHGAGVLAVVTMLAGCADTRDVSLRACPPAPLDLSAVGATCSFEGTCTYAEPTLIGAPNPGGRERASCTCGADGRFHCDPGCARSLDLRDVCALDPGEGAPCSGSNAECIVEDPRGDPLAPTGRVCACDGDPKTWRCVPWLPGPRPSFGVSFLPDRTCSGW